MAKETALFDEARAIAAEIGLSSERIIVAATLAHGEQRALEVGLALATQPKLVLLDEPMAGMGPEESQRMIELIERIRASVTVLLVEHDMDAVFRLADRISVLVDGRVIATGMPGEDPRATRKCAGPTSGTKRLLEVENLETAYGASQVLFGFRLEIRDGRGGDAARPQRHGQDHHRALDHGTDPALSGSISLPRRAHRAHAPDRIARLGIALVPEGRQIFPNLTRAREPGRLRREPQRRAPIPGRSRRFSSSFRSLKERQDNMGNQLSGGEQQMLAIGRALVTNPHLLILDEATEGLAPLVREEIWKCLERAARRGADDPGDRQVHRAPGEARRPPHHHRARPRRLAGQLGRARRRPQPLASLPRRMKPDLRWPKSKQELLADPEEAKATSRSSAPGSRAS